MFVEPESTSLGLPYDIELECEYRLVFHDVFLSRDSGGWARRRLVHPNPPEAKRSLAKPAELAKLVSRIGTMGAKLLAKKVVVDLVPIAVDEHDRFGFQDLGHLGDRRDVDGFTGVGIPAVGRGEVHGWRDGESAFYLR